MREFTTSRISTKEKIKLKKKTFEMMTPAVIKTAKTT